MCMHLLSWEVGAYLWKVWTVAKVTGHIFLYLTMHSYMLQFIAFPLEYNWLKVLVTRKWDNVDFSVSKSKMVLK